MKNILKIFCICFCFAQVSAAEKITITVNQFVSHIALDAAYSGLLAGFEERNYPDKLNIIFANAQGNIGNSVQIAKHHSSLKPRFMIAIATPAAQTMLKAKSAGSVLSFLAVSDPAAAGLEREEIIGITDSPPLEKLIVETIKILPDINSIGVIFNSGEINSTKTVEKLSRLLQQHNIALKKISINNSNEIKTAFNKLARQVDAIYLPQDNSVISALDSIVNLSVSHKIPLIANDPTLVDKGVLLAIGSNYFESGKQLAFMIVDLIEGREISLKIQQPIFEELKMNHDLAENFNIKRD